MSPRPVIVEVVKRRPTITLVKSPPQPKPASAPPVAKKPPKPEAVALGKSIAAECPDLATLFAKHGGMRLHRAEEALRAVEAMPLLRELRFFVGSLTLRGLATAAAPEAMPDGAPIVAPELAEQHRARVQRSDTAERARIAAALAAIPAEPKDNYGLRLLSAAGEIAPGWPIGLLAGVLTRNHPKAALSLRGTVLSCRAGRFSAMTTAVLGQLDEGTA